MAIKDRGKMKWQGAFFMPQHVKMLGDIRTDYYRTNKPELDAYQLIELDERICAAMAHNLPIKLTVWEGGFTRDINGMVHFIDPLTKELRIEIKPGEYERVKFEVIINIVVMD
jgi:hypothetical protein